MRDEAPLPSPIKIAVFPFELEDSSAASQAGSAPDEAKYLAESTEEAKRLLLQSGRYLPIDAGPATSGQDLRDCKGCEAATADYVREGLPNVEQKDEPTNVLSIKADYVPVIKVDGEHDQDTLAAFP
jgi:hypothetical protein